MGQYNPRVPDVLGIEWVGIRDENVTFSPAVNVVELGYRFRNDAARTLVDGRFYTRGLPPGTSDNQAYMMNVYPAGTEDQTGPIRRCVIPVNSVATTGTFDVAPTVPILSGVTNGNAQIIVNAAATQKSMALFFAVNQFAQELNGKRIVAVNLLHQLAWNPVNANSLETAERFGELILNSNIRWLTGGTTSFASVGLAPETYAQLSGSDVHAIPRLLAFGDDVVQVGTFGDARISRVRLGDTNWVWATPTTPATSVVMPWRYDELKRFEVSAGTNRYWIQYDFGASTRWLGEFWFGYAALEVLYCEEKRVVAGGVDPTFPLSGTGGTMAPYDFRTQVASLRDLPTLSASPALPVGEYTVTVNACDVGDRTGTFAAPVSKPATANVYPELNGIRQLDRIETHPGVRVNVTQTEHEVFTAEETDVLMQLTLHESGAPVANCHGYGQIARAQVWGTRVARQDLLASSVIAPVTGEYDQARFYARRFGDTAVPLRMQDMNDNARYVEITPEDFDELPAILDGWKEVTLRFNTSLSVHSASTNPFFEWEAPLETAGNRWEVLGLTAPAVSGLPGQPFTQAPAAHRLGPTTYGGTTVFADWMPQYAPPISGTDEDQTTDIILLLSEDPATVTGLAVTGLSQELTAYTECGAGPCCVPSELQYNRVTWSLPNGTDTASDAWDRVEVAGWGTADDGGAWTIITTPADYSADGEEGVITFSAVSSRRESTLAVNAVDFDIQVDVTFVDEIASGAMTAGVIGRFTDVTNYYSAVLRHDSAGALELWIQELVGGVFTLIASRSLGTVVERGARYTVRFAGAGPILKAKTWRTDLEEPDGWQIETSDTSLTTGGEVGIFANDTSAVTGHRLRFDNFSASPPRSWFGYYELQRTDTVEDEWKTIMKATDPGTASFNDYEARVGVESSYRIRAVNALRFEGLWSDEVDITLPEPGVTLPACGTDKRGVLIFTTNEVQDGSSNLAYAMVWEGSVSEDFSFIEANSVQVLPMFDRDYQVAFHGTERGGEAFTRTMLLANAAVAEPRLANAHSLRDLAWADLPYVCVRDDIGDRWLAAVIVPGLNARRNRRLYNASLTVIEVSDTPSPVDP
jgi:hypothetical protein